jgi:hypothetical protein
MPIPISPIDKIPTVASGAMLNAGSLDIGEFECSDCASLELYLTATVKDVKLKCAQH